MGNGRLVKVTIENENDQETMVKREFFLSKQVFNAIVDDINFKAGKTEGRVTFSSWVYDACRQKLDKEHKGGKSYIDLV